jgi:hypothetical protein
MGGGGRGCFRFLPRFFGPEGGGAGSCLIGGMNSGVGDAADGVLRLRRCAMIDSKSNSLGRL